jgi:hypothetical protein
MAVVTQQPKPAGASEPRFVPEAFQASIELYWLPLGAGGWLVRLNGRIYEAITRSWSAGGRWAFTTPRS